jgi:uncharacterized membrane protein (DUF2068 family)
MTASTTPVETAPQKRKRPFGVNAIIVLSTLSVLYSITLATLMGVGVFLVEGGLAEMPYLARLELARWLMIYLIATSVVQVAIIIGLWRLRRWGWFLVMLHTGVGLFLNIWAYFHSRPNYFAMLASVLIVLYLNQREVQQAFIEPEQEPPPL